MSSLFDNDSTYDVVSVTCEKCRETFDEIHGVAVWKSRHPSKALLCIQCDPEASERALVRVTPAGNAQAS